MYNKINANINEYQQKRGLTEKRFPNLNQLLREFEIMTKKQKRSAQRINTAINKALPKSKKLREAKEKYDDNIKNLEKRRDRTELNKKKLW